MKRFWQRLTVSFFTALLVLVGLTAQESFATSKEKTLLYVPLDSRPVNTDVLQKMSEVVGVHVLSPPEQYLGNLTTSGDTETLTSWVLEHAKDADGFLLSSDMLAYGGLVASRTNSSSENDALERLTVLNVLKEAYPEKEVMVYASLLRLAPTIESKNDVTAYEQLRAWAILKGHPKKNKTAIGVLEKKMDASLLQTYTTMRHRNLSVNQALVQYAKNGVIDVLIFGQDDAASEGIHVVEKEQLQQQVAKEKLANVSFISGMDEVGSMLFTRFGFMQKQMTPTVYVVYDHPFAPFWTSPFDAEHVAENIHHHLDVVGMKRTYLPFLADVYLYVNTPYPNLYPIPTHRLAVADMAFVNKSDSDFVDDLLENTSLNEIYGYSGWNTGGNSIGLSLSFAGARILSLASESEAQTLAHASLLYRSFLLDNDYKTTLYPTLKEQVEQAGDDPYSLGEKATVYEEVLNKELKKESNNLFDSYFKDEKLPINQNQTAFVTLKRVTLPPATFPWERLFDIRLTPEFQVK